MLGEKCFLETVEFWIEDDRNVVSIGDATTIHGTTHLAATEGKSIIIGKDCMFSSAVTVRTGDSHSIVKKNSKERINYANDVHIGDHVWLGNKTIILKGAKVADHTIVATGAIVTNKHEQRNTILAGIPARVVKEEVDWLRERVK